MQNFYPRSPCGERQRYFTYFFGRLLFLSTLSLRRATLFRQNYECFEWIFLSTLSLRRATNLKRRCLLEYTHFYPRSPCGERLLIRYRISARYTISIHALLAESDFTSAGWFQIIRYFYPRSPCGERRRFRAIHDTKIDISIHALLAESDILAGLWVLSTQIFLSTLSLRRATRETTSIKPIFGISIHALLAESDVAPVLAVGRS